MNEVVIGFDHLSTHLALIGLKVKVLKCKTLKSIGVSLGIEIP
jgi:hypothetical protein